MEYIVYFVLAILACGIYVGYSENEIDSYDQTPRISFYSSIHVRTLADTDYVKINDPYAVDSFIARIQGDPLKENRDFCVRVTPNNDYQNSVDILLESEYIYTELDTICQVFYHKISRPKTESGRNMYGCYLEFDLDNPLRQLDKELVEKNQEVLNVRWELKPDEWEGWIFGSYSDNKHMFIMDVCQHVWDDPEDEDIDKVKQAYKEYIEAENPPILGEDGDEIDYE